MYQLEEKIWFWVLAVIPVIILFFLVLQIWKRHAQKKFANKKLLKRLSPNQSLFKSILKLVVICLAIASLAIALVNPKFGTKLETVKREGVDVVFAVDVSKSMLAEDIAPNRLEKSKQLVSQIINNLGSYRVGIVAYAGSAFPQLPITTDYSAARMFLQALNTDMVSSQGTAINEAIELAQTYFNDAAQTNRVVVLVSDGEDHEGDMDDVVREAARNGIRIISIGVGTAGGGPIPERSNGVVQRYKRDNDGNTVITRLDEATLEEIASSTDGIYIDGSVTQQAVSQVTEYLQRMDKAEFESKQIADFKDQFQWFLGIGLVLLLLDIFLLERKTEWLKKLNLFNDQR